MRKAFALIVCLSVLLTLTAFPSVLCAENYDAEVTAECVLTEATKLTVTVKIESEERIEALNIALKYDADKLNFAGFTVGALIKDIANVSISSRIDESNVISITALEYDSHKKWSGTLAVIEFSCTEKITESPFLLYGFDGEKSIIDNMLTPCATKYTVILPESDTSMLVTALDSASHYEQSVYTEESWSVFAAALEAADEAKGFSGFRQSDIDAAASNLSEAISGLVPATVKGDVDLSGGVTISDALTLFKHVAGVELMTDAKSLSAADIDGTGGVTISDALTLFKFVAGIIGSL